MTASSPSPEAQDAAGVLLNKLDADHITEIRAASWARATDVLARALDEFARQAVERERRRCAGIVKLGRLIPRRSYDALQAEILSGEAP